MCFLSDVPLEHAQGAWVHSDPASPPLVMGSGCQLLCSLVPQAPSSLCLPLPTLQPLPPFTQGSPRLIYSTIPPLLPRGLAQEGSQSGISEQGMAMAVPTLGRQHHSSFLGPKEGQACHSTPVQVRLSWGSRAKGRETGFSSPENRQMHKC